VHATRRSFIHGCEPLTSSSIYQKHILIIQPWIISDCNFVDVALWIRIYSCIFSSDRIEKVIRHSRGWRDSGSESNWKRRPSGMESESESESPKITLPFLSTFLYIFLFLFLVPHRWQLNFCWFSNVTPVSWRFSEGLLYINW